ncbi:IclR family transcriptional regulator [Nocardioides sp.]|uniref:IclR family transcriptional regulator n=1 Tax=Nocardioides sp. TaxID=35761 RepID=UPI002ED0E5C6
MERAAALLRAVAAATGSAGSATALAATVGLNRTTTWRILTTLEHERLVTHDPETGTYTLGFGLIDLAGQADGVALVRSARVVLQQLAAAARETAALAVVRGGALTYVAESTADTVVAAGWQGREVAIHATSTGKVLLAFSHPAELRVLLRLPQGSRLPRYTPATITSLATLEKELALTRERGYAVCRGEFESTAWGVSAPVLDLAGHPVAVVSVWGPSERLGEDRFEELGAMAIAAAAEITGRGASPSA